MTTERPAVAVLGTGAVGAALARTLYRHRHPVTVWNRTPAKALALAGQGIAAAPTAAQAATGAELVFLCLTDHAACRSVAEEVAGAAAGRTVVNLSTGSPEQARAMAQWARRQGADYIDGALQADAAEIGTPGCALLYAGDRGVFQRHAATLHRLGAATHLAEDPGAAGLHHLALLGLWYETQTAYLKTLALLSSAGVDPQVFAPAAARQIRHVAEAASETAREAAERRYPRGPATLAEHAPVLEQVAALQRSHGMDPAQPQRTAALVARLIQEGESGVGFTRLVEEFTAT